MGLCLNQFKRLAIISCGSKTHEERERERERERRNCTKIVSLRQEKHQRHNKRAERKQKNEKKRRWVYKEMIWASCV